MPLYSWQRGFNFRAGATFVNDQPPETYVIGAQYPVARNGVTFGWVGAANTNTRDRVSTLDRRLAGINFASNGGAGATLQVDLPGAGTYDLRLAIGDDSSSHAPQYVQITDTDSGAILYTLNLPSGTSNQIADAQGNLWSHNSAAGQPKDWPARNRPVRLAMGRSIRVRIGAPTGSDVSTIEHLWLGRVSRPSAAILAAVVASSGGGGAQAITPTGIGSAESFGMAVVAPGSVAITPTGIASAEAFGTTIIAAGAVNIAPAGIGSAESFGTAVIGVSALNIAPGGIASLESFGTAVVAPGPVSIQPDVIPSTESFGTTVVSQAGSQSILPAGIGSLESFGTTVIAAGAINIAPAGISSAESFGTATIARGPVSITPAGITSLESFGIAVISQPNGPQGITVPGIGSAERFGTVVLSIQTTGSPILFAPGLFPAYLFPPPLYPDGATFGGIAPDFLSALYSYLRGLSSLSTLTKIHLNKAKKPLYPFMMIYSNFTPMPTFNNSPTYWEDQPIQVNVFARTDAQAMTLGRAALSALSPKNSDGTAAPKLVFADGYEMVRFPSSARLLEQPGQGPGQLPVWQFVFDICFTLGRIMGA